MGTSKDLTGGGDAVERVIEKLWGPKDVAEYLDVPLQTVYAWASQRKGPKSFRVGRHRRYRKSAVDSWLEGQANRVAS